MFFWKRCALFSLGGTGYVGLEMLWRGRSHISMFFAGGICMLLIGHLEEVEPRLPAPLRAAVGAGIITATELAVGLLFNRSYGVWDYRDRWGNFLGQICPAFCALWIPLAWLAGYLYIRWDRRLDRLFAGKEKGPKPL